MKKNILSLVAFMAFSVGAFANTIEVKEEVVSVETEKIFEEFKEETLVDDCAAQAMKLGDFIEALGGSEADAYWWTNAYYDWCIS